jgi:predicted dehydrogenase/nucleoside-diphosphate-sugar epimerase
MRRVVLVGAGFIAQVHAEVLRGIPEVELHAVVDRHGGAAKALAETWGVRRVFASAEDAILSGEIDCAHILTPPNAHTAAALPFLEAGIASLIEKPLAKSGAECEALQSAARGSGALLCANQNFVYHPAFLRLRRAVERRTLGGLRFVSCCYNMPLQQITDRQFGHWMFAQPVNILLEQAVHPLSQIVALAGRIEEIRSLAGSPIALYRERTLHASLGVVARCRHSLAELRFSVGESFPFWQITAVCDDGVAVADIVYNRFFTYRRTRWLEPLDHFLSGGASGAAMLGHSISNVARYAAATAKLAPRSDPFFRSMRTSIAAFHSALDRNVVPEIDGAFGAHLVAVCEEVARGLPASEARPASIAKSGRYDVLVLGGTGFIGRAVVARLLTDGYRVGVMARNPQNLGPPFDSENVVLMQGDARCGAHVEQAVSGARIVVNLAHGGAEGVDAMVAAAEVVARACLAHPIERLLHAGSIAGLYLGPQPGTVTGTAPPDPHAHRRSSYARGKAECDRLLMQLHAIDGLPVCVLRPGAVVGQGGVAAHGALGFFNNDQHCLGWNSGKNPLPFILVEDVAEAFRLACTAPGVVGRCYNLVGGVRLSAREYIFELGEALGRPIRFHPKNPTILWLQEVGKWAVKRVTGRKSPLPTRYDLLARGLSARFDCSDAERDLNWRPVRDRERFIERAIKIHGRRAAGQ